MKSSLWAKIAIGVLLLSAAFTLGSGQVGEAYAAPHHGGYHGGYHGYYGGVYYSGWYYPYYWYYPYSYCYSPYYGYYYGYLCSSYPYSQPLQYQLTVSTDPPNLSGAVTGGGSYNLGASASFSTQNVIQVSKDTRYVFSRWKGDYSGTGSTAALTMDKSKTVTAVYQLQYYLTVGAQPSTAPSPNGLGWFNAGDTATVTLPAQIVGGDGGARLVFDQWNVDGANVQKTSVFSLPMNAPHTVIAQYKQQYYLSVSSDQGVPSGTGWYDAGSNAQISVSAPPNPSYGVNLVFSGWNGDAQSTSQSATVLMDGPKTVTATWRTDHTVLYVTIAAVLVAILLVAGVVLYSLSQRKTATSTPVTSTVVTTTPVTSTELCHQCGKPVSPVTNYCASCGAPQKLDANADSKPQRHSSHPRRRGRAARHTEGTAITEGHRDEKPEDAASGATTNS